MTMNKLYDKLFHYNKWEKEAFINKWRREEIEREVERYRKEYEPTITDMYRYMDIPLTDKCVVNISFEDKKEEKKMKLSDFIKKYGDCEVTEEMEKCIKKKKGKWMRECGQFYFLVFSNGFVARSSWDGDTEDNYRRDFLRIFKTEEEAKRYLEIQKACKEASFEPDWEDDVQNKYTFYYNYCDKQLRVTYHNSCNYGEQFLFETGEIIKDLINKFGEKDIAKYVLGVEIED